METLTVHPARPLLGTIEVPGDKSISHRAIMLGALSQGTTSISGCLDAEDCRATQAAFTTLGIPVQWTADRVVIDGRGQLGLTAPTQPIDCGNSGTTMRLLLGVLAGQPFRATLTGDASLSKRPMKRVTQVLRRMGARIEGQDDGNLAPLTIQGGALKGITYELPVPSAQVKSAILLAGLYVQDGVTVVKELVLTRDHTERMLLAMGLGDHLSILGDPLDGRTVTLRGGTALQGRQFRIPGDPSSAAFWLVAAALVRESSVTVRDVGLNPTRTGFLQVLQGMGAKVTVRPAPDDGWEPRGDVTVEWAPLHGTTIRRSLLPQLIDELPILMAAAAAAEGRTVIEEASELRVKETDRIESMRTNLMTLGVRVVVEGHTVIIEGPARLRGATVSSFGDHRTAMAAAIAGLAADGPVTIQDTACIRTSYPSFEGTLRTLTAR